MSLRATLLLPLLLLGPLPAAAETATLDIPFESFRLDNGLTVVVHEDRKAPIVSVNLWYHVGSKDEPVRRTGFAHLFEHLMFAGTEHYREDFHRPFELVGATGQNGSTNQDRTDYYQTVPSTALDMALWMESDRMGNLLPAIDQKKLDLQRGVVQNEKRERENEPYGKLWESLFSAAFPEGHPYHRSIIGSMEDLNAATLDDVKAWFGEYYGAANVVLVLAGDIDAKTAKEKVQRYFGHIPAGPPLTRRGAWVAAREESTRGEMQDRVPQPAVVRVWNVPGAGSDDATLLQLASQVLGGSAASRLDARLVYREQSVDSVGTYVASMEIAGLFAIQAFVKATGDTAKVEAALDQELQKFLAEGPGEAELERARTVLRSRFARGIEQVAGKSDTLAECATFARDPGCFRHDLALVAKATPAQVRDAARRWLSKGDHTLVVRPFPAFRNEAASAVDRSGGPPKVEQFPDLAFPALERGKLANGMPVVLARRAGAPVLEIDLQFDAGFAADAGRKPGTADFASSMLREGSGGMDALAFKSRAEELGAGLGANSGLDSTTASLSALREKLEPSLALFAGMVRRPTFAEPDIARLKQQWLANIAQEKADPQGIAYRLLPPLLYGEGHPYAIPFSGSGTEAAIASLARADLLAFQRDWLRPDNATVIVAGDITMAEVVPLLDRHFGDWRAEGGAKPVKALATVPAAATSRVYLVDKPGAVQSTLLAGQLAPSSRSPQRFELQTANAVLGGIFTSRLNMNLREDKHWSYGVGSYLAGALGQRPWLLSAPVQTDKTRESLVELRKELAEYLDTRPATSEEITKIKQRDVRSLPGRYETVAAVAGTVAGIVQFGYPDDYVLGLKARIEGQRDDDVRAQAKAVLTPAALTWVIVGDLSKIEQPVRELGIGEVKIMDEDGRILR